MVSYVRHLFQTESLLIILMPIAQILVLIILIWGLHQVVKKLIAFSCFVLNMLRKTIPTNKGTKGSPNQQDLIDINT